MKSEIFSERLKECRVKCHLTQDDLSQKINISRSAYANYESGLREPNFTILKKLSEVLGVSTDYLLGLTEDQTLNK